MINNDKDIIIIIIINEKASTYKLYAITKKKSEIYGER